MKTHKNADDYVVSIYKNLRDDHSYLLKYTYLL